MVYRIAFLRSAFKTKKLNQPKPVSSAFAFMRIAAPINTYRCLGAPMRIYQPMSAISFVALMAPFLTPIAACVSQGLAKDNH